MTSFTERRIAAQSEFRNELAEVIFNHNSRAIGSAVTFFYATTRMRKTAYEYADLIISSHVLPDYLALLDRIVAGLRGDDQEKPNGMISVDYAEEIVREEFEYYAGRTSSGKGPEA